MPPAKAPAMLTVDQILEADDLATEVYEIPEWGGAVKLKQLSRRQWKTIGEESKINGEIDDDLFELKLVVVSVVEPDLTDDRVEQLRGKNAIVLQRLIARILVFNNVQDGAFANVVATFQDEED